MVCFKQTQGKEEHPQNLAHVHSRYLKDNSWSAEPCRLGTSYNPPQDSLPLNFPGTSVFSSVKLASWETNKYLATKAHGKMCREFPVLYNE